MSKYEQEEYIPFVKEDSPFGETEILGVKFVQGSKETVFLSKAQIESIMNRARGTKIRCENKGKTGYQVVYASNFIELKEPKD